MPIFHSSFVLESLVKVPEVGKVGRNVLDMADAWDCWVHKDWDSENLVPVWKVGCGRGKEVGMVE